MALSVLLLATLASPALGPDDIYLIVNKNVPASQEVADHYLAKRKVPKDHVIVLDLPTGEDISRADYEAKMVAPLRKTLADNKDKVKVLVSTSGVPLRVGREQPSTEEKEAAAEIDKELVPIYKSRDAVRDAIKKLEERAKADPDGDAAKDLKAKRQELAEVDARVRTRETQRNRWRHAETEACVDSELALLWFDKYELYRWRANPLNWRFPAEGRKGQAPVIMTARLDGPNAALVKRLIDDAVEVEAKGLEGKVYVDARGIKLDLKSDPSGTGYGGYDESLREMAKLLETAKLDVTLDDKGDLFKPDACPNCALYCGWYSLGNFVDSCKFVKGAVAYHIASSEAVTLRNPKTKQWCKNQLEKGACATLGPVAEPYTVGFPKPAEFFGLLATGEHTLVECYWKTQYFTSWMTVLVGDPLYNPYAKKSKLKPDDVKASPAGSRAPFGR